MGNRLSKFLLSLVLLISLSFAASPAFAAGEDIIKNQNTIIPESQLAENVVVLGGDATIYGSVRKAVIVFDGNLELKPTAKVRGLVLVMGGSITQAPQAQVTDNIININFNEATKNSMLMGIALLVGFWIFSFFISVLIIFIPVIIHLIAKDRLEPLHHLARQRPRRPLLLGRVASLLLLGLCILLSITIIGIPIAGLLIFLAIIAFFLGLTVMGKLVGHWVPGKENRPAWLTVTIGAVLLAAAMNLPLIGFIVFLLLFWQSLGMVILWVRDWRKKRKQVGE